MGQSGVSMTTANPGTGRPLAATSMPFLGIFPTEIGWMGLAGRERIVERLVIGHFSAEAVWGHLTTEAGGDFTECDWFPELRSRLEAFAEGQCTDFSDVAVDLSHLTAFQHRVVVELRKVPFGQTLSYAELAARAGSPKAARAVGSVMAQNRVPLIIPCHRVVGSGGSLGGFSAPRGIAFKKQLLALEANPSPQLLDVVS